MPSCDIAQLGCPEESDEDYIMNSGDRCVMHVEMLAAILAVLSGLSYQMKRISRNTQYSISHILVEAD